jgi:Ca-activated chloride channel family protein
MEFQHQSFILIAIPALIAAAIGFRVGEKGRLRFSSIAGLKASAQPGGPRTARLIRVFRYLALIALATALAGPRLGVSGTKRFSYGADLLIAIDTSASMTQEDFRDRDGYVSRLEAAKEVLTTFIDQRTNNRIGIISFASHVRTHAPLTLDYDMLKGVAQDIKAAGPEDDGTAVGMAIAHSVNRLRRSQVKSRAVILLTDGESNCGWLSPRNGAQLARGEGVRVFCIGITPEDTRASNVDEILMRDITRSTGGRYFRAEDVTALSRVYQRIDDMSATDITRPDYAQYKEFAPLFILAAFGLYFIEMILRNTVFLTVP